MHFTGTTRVLLAIVLSFSICSTTLLWKVRVNTSMYSDNAFDLLRKIEGRYKVENTRMSSNLSSFSRTKVVDHLHYLPCVNYEICHVTQDVYLLILMVSAPMNFERRERQRQTCLNVTEVSGKRIEKLFLLGNSGNSSLDMSIHEESLKFQDIFVGDYQDSYENLTLKTISGMNWAGLCCRQATFVMKVDDDVFINFKLLIDALIKAPKKRGYIVGRVSFNPRPIRDTKDKWYISYNTYSKQVYPDYVSGLAYVMSGDLPRRIFHMSLSTPSFPWEDVYIGMILEKLNVRPKHNPCFQLENFNPIRKKRNFCRMITACVIHFENPENVFQHYKNLKIWMNSSTHYKC